MADIVTSVSSSCKLDHVELLGSIERAIEDMPPGEIRARMPAAERTAAALYLGLWRDDDAARALEVWERASAHLDAIDDAERRGDEAAEAAEVALADAERHARGESTAGRPSPSTARLLCDTALHHAEQAVGAFHEAGLPAQVALLTARVAHIEARRGLFKHLTDATAALSNASLYVGHIHRIVAAGGVQDIHGKVRSSGRQKVPEYHRRAREAVERSINILWACEVAAVEDDPLVITARECCEMVRDIVDVCPSSMPAQRAARRTA